MNANAKVIGLDIAKDVFVMVGLDRNGKVIWKRKLWRDQLLPAFRELEPTAVGIEACAGSHYWARAIAELGHDVKLIAAQHTRAYVTGNKNDTNDAAAIAEARSRSSTKYVPINTAAQQDLQMLHRARSALMKERTGMINRIRAFAGEYGRVFARGVAKFRDGLKAWLADPENGLSGAALETFRELKAQLDDKQQRIQEYERRLHRAAKDEKAQKLMEIPGVGPIIATAVLASVADARHYRSGRDFAANLGLVPREHSSGGKQRLYGLNGKGDAYLRTQIIHGCRSALRCAGNKPDQLLRWASKVGERRSFNVAAVALANKTARVIWALLAHGRSYVPVWSNSTTRPA
jgi:transposase